MPITEQRKLFNTYRAAGNSDYKSAELAGFKHPRIVATKIANNAEVRAHFDELTKDIKNERIATATERQEFWTAVYKGDKSVCDPVLDNNGDPVPDFINGGFKVYPLKMVDRLKASDLLGKAQQDFVERTQIDVNISVISQLMNDLEGTTLQPKILSDQSAVIEGTVLESE